ncbi:TlpA family protein disulfide reductase [Robertkochia solimangrovi]|uniref:TlpA family protein disulfide reductase n=1 Tax=Robertkochia solimangrovi TaxID=2213046 RepID=UPI00117F2767|nr:TlpA disulfide reductase family protein [Robertkochia solimangrovi]TRZ46095.1 hypothetical protein DMZ48_02170 [Robertkochia solimangrovi]
MKLRILILLVLQFSFISCARNVRERNESDKNCVVIKGRVEGDAKKFKNIKINFGHLFMVNPKINAIDTMLSISKGGDFYFKSAPIDRPTRINIIPSAADMHPGNANYTNSLRNYLVEPGDSIFININLNNDLLVWEFSGKGAAKFEVKWEFQVFYHTSKKTFLNKQEPVNSWVEYYQNLFRTGDSLTSCFQHRLNRYRDRLSPQTFEVVQADFTGKLNFFYKNFWFVRNSYLTPENLMILRKLYASISTEAMSNETMAQSMEMVNYLIYYEIMGALLDNPKDEDLYFQNIFNRKYAEICNLLQTHYDGPLREMLIMNYLLNNFTGDTTGWNNCAINSVSFIQSEPLKSIFEKLNNHQIKGSKGYDFSLPDAQGVYVDLHDFKGKVVYLEIWFTGCSGCIALTKEIKEKLYPRFRNNKEIVFVTVCVDKDKQKWLHSLATERYSSPDFVNLYTEGSGLKHPFANYYNVAAAPTTMVFDKQGNIFSSRPPKHGKMDALEELLMEAINFEPLKADSSNSESDDLHIRQPDNQR